MRRAERCVIVGGGPAGASAAIMLANAATPVTILERKREAQHKVCGEFISWEAADYLQALGLDLPGSGAQAIRQLRLYNRHQLVRAPLAKTAWSLSRKRLDAELLRLARAAGAKVRHGVAVNRLVPENPGWRVETRNKDLPVLHADTVFLASGKYDLRHWERRHGKSSLIGLKMHYLLAPDQHEALQESVEIHLFDGGYAGLEPIEEGKANLCFLINKDIYHRHQKQWQSVVRWLCEMSPQLQRRLHKALPCWPQPLAVYGIPYGYLCKSDAAAPGIFRLGDQAAVIPSFAGDGIAMALHSGILAAQHHSAETSEQDYYRQLREDFRQPLANALRFEKILESPFGRSTALRIARYTPSLLQSVISRTRLTKKLDLRLQIE